MRRKDPNKYITVVGDVAYVRLTKGQVAIVDAEDVDRVSGKFWSASRSWRTWYASSRSERMHRRILGLSGEIVTIDHINGNGLDNRKANLRVSTKQENARNSKRYERRQPTRHTSRFKGVEKRCDKPRQYPWRASIYVDGKRVGLGGYRTEEEAARAYDEAAREHFGEFARLNFPDDAGRLALRVDHLTEARCACYSSCNRRPSATGAPKKSGAGRRFSVLSGSVPRVSRYDVPHTVVIRTPG